MWLIVEKQPLQQSILLNVFQGFTIENEINKWVRVGWWNLYLLYPNSFFIYCFSHSLTTFLSCDFPVKCFLMNIFYLVIELIWFVCMSITNLPSDEVNKVQPCLQHCMEEMVYWLYVKLSCILMKNVFIYLLYIYATFHSGAHGNVHNGSISCFSIQPPCEIVGLRKNNWSKGFQAMGGLQLDSPDF